MSDAGEAKGLGGYGIPATALRLRTVNVGTSERWASALAGGGALALAAARRDGWSLPLTLLGGYLVKRGALGHCGLYASAGISTVRGMPTRGNESPGTITRLRARRMYVQRSATIARPREELYRFWRDLRNWPRFAEWLQAVDEMPDRRLRWTLTGSNGHRIGWDVTIDADAPNEWFTWRTMPDAPVDLLGKISFRDAGPGRGTEVTSQLGPTGERGSKLVSKLPGTHIALEELLRRDLAHAKALLETGELPTSAGPSGRKR